MRTLLITTIGIAFPIAIFCSKKNIKTIQDSTTVIELEEIMINESATNQEKSIKNLASTDEYLEKNSSINMIKRGAYAFEPFLNGMSSERNMITIDGMRIYAACTDKMDPVTSYVEVTNLKKIEVNSGPSSVFGNSIAGSIDLVSSKIYFGERKNTTTLFTGFESNNQQKIIGTKWSHVDNKLFSTLDFTFRSADNYKAGGGKEILYSPYTKYNTSAIVAYQLKNKKQIAASFLYDHAVNVGYPALPMDVSLARAILAAVSYVQDEPMPNIKKWETKLYVNQVTHIMDDTKRPVVPVRMDMPGWSTTAGFYTLINGEQSKHNWQVNFSGHYNRSLAEMTMYANNSQEKDMFMLTWPGILTHYMDLFATETYQWNPNWKTNISLGLAVNNNTIDNQLGIESLSIFYPQLNKTKNRFLKRTSLINYYQKSDWTISLGISYGERAPTVSEAYGFYLFNSFDQHDYIGNPNLKNEKTINTSLAIGIKKDQVASNFTIKHFYLMDYTIGLPAINLSAMTIGASGIKKYQQLQQAHIFNIAYELNYEFIRNLIWQNQLSYRYGTSPSIDRLPFIQPLAFQTSISYTINQYIIDLSINGSTQQERYNLDFGEKPVPAYAIMHLAVAYKKLFKEQSVTIKAGIENIMDKKYTTFADWNRLERMGRNLYVHIIYKQ